MIQGYRVTICLDFKDKAEADFWVLRFEHSERLNLEELFNDATIVNADWVVDKAEIEEPDLSE